ncbi:uncharacterized protein V6R79_001525 [Siganus canaliculatus]
MKHCLVSVCFVGSVLHVLTQRSVPASEFHLEGDYILGGLFDIHLVPGPTYYDKPEVIDCSSKPFHVARYRRLQLMRFAVEEINNSTNLLPNVSLGYEIFDHCSDTHFFPEVLKLVSVNEVIHVWDESWKRNLSKVIAVVGASSSAKTRSVAAPFMMNLIPMVSYAASSSIFSMKDNFPSFLRTVRPNKDIIEVIVKLLQHFNWRWVAFLNIDDEYGNDGLQVFMKMIKDTEICLAYTKGLSNSTDYTPVFKQIKELMISTIIVYAPDYTAEALVLSAIELNISDKVWIAGDAWSLSERLPKKKGIRSIGTVLGVAEPVVPIPGLSDFIHTTRSQNHCENEQLFCNQVCNCSGVSAERIINTGTTFSFTVYSAVYAIAHSLHRVLQCGSDSCNNITVYPHMVLAELKKSNFTLLNQSIAFDENGDPQHGHYVIVYWNYTGEVEEVGFYQFQPSSHLYINNNTIQWHTNEVPISVCSPECREGYKRKYDGVHQCCFACEKCPKGTFVNSTSDPYTCQTCNKETEWSAEGSTSCSLREVEYISFTDTGAILVMVGALVFVALTLAMSVLFAINYNTPVIRSAGGPMCFLILGCLSLSSLSVFFYFDKPTVPFCTLRFLPFLLFYTVCLACFAVRSFQIFCIFKLAAKFKNIKQRWMKYHMQWLVIAVTSMTQTLLLVFDYSYHPPTPKKIIEWQPDKIILDCKHHLDGSRVSLVLFLLLCLLCFIFSYMGKDLPKNYNEAKSITFCLMLLILTWTICGTVFIVYRGKYNQILNALAVLSSLYSFLLFYFLPKCYIIIFQSHKNTQQYFQSLIHSYTNAISQ